MNEPIETQATTENSARKKSWLPMAVIACVAIAAGVFAGTFQPNRPTDTGNANHSAAESADNDALKAVQAELQNSLLFPHDYKTVPPFSLVYGDNLALTETNLKDKWSVLFFGFTNCPDVCPVTLNEMNSAVAQLNDEGIESPQVIFITVDPVRDTLEKTTQYVNYFNQDFIGGTGELGDITSLARSLGVVASYTASPDGGNNYSVDHTASMLVIGPELKVRAKLNAPHVADTLSADLKTLLTHL